MIDETIKGKLLNIQNKLVIKHGTFYDEYPEQLLSVKYLKGDEKILELGGNIGRNSLIISSILTDSHNLVVLESDKEIAKKLEENRNNNGYNFSIIDKALSLKPLIQRGWNCIVSDNVLPGYKRVDTIDYTTLKKETNINFDTLIVDCEGGFYYILLDMPEILENIKLIIMENDYVNHQHKIYVDHVLRKNNFEVDFYMPLEGHPGLFPQTRHKFYEVWKK